MKKVNKSLITILFLTLLSGCAGSPASISMASPQALSSMSNLDLVNAWAEFHTANARIELERRGIFSPTEWALIDRKEVSPGMSKVALYASWGFPIRGETYTDQQGTGKVFYYPRKSVFLLNDKVVAIREHH